MRQYLKINGRRFLVLSGFTFAFIISPAILRGQTPSSEGAVPGRATTQAKGETAKDQLSSDPEKGKWSVKVSKGTPQTFSVKSKEAKLSEITEELSRILKVPVKLSSIMVKQRVTVDLAGMNIEAVIRMLAPHAYIDYEIGGGQFQPQILAIYLQALNERPPSINETVKGNSEAILIEGDTEEGTGDAETQKKREEAMPLKVSYAKNQISVRANKQPLSVVLSKIASEVGIPFEMRFDDPELIDVEFNNYTLDQAVRSLSPAARYFYRTDLQTYDIQPLRIALLAPATTKSED